MIRAGIYKPLTFPYRSKKYFELGDKGVRIIEEMKNFDIVVVSEIMDSDKLQHVNDVVDVFQIGARNMQNFNLITKVAKKINQFYLKGILVALSDLLGAAEYALIENENVILCERVFLLLIPTEARVGFYLIYKQYRQCKENSCLPIISDPSHASFWHKWVRPLSLASLAVGAEGLMIETHPDPRNAAVDPLQPISFEEFSSLVMS